MSTPAAPKPALKKTQRRILLAVAVIAALLLTYTLAGFVLAPWLARRELPQLAEKHLQRRAHVGDVAFNPYTLTLRVSDFALEERDGRPLFGFRNAVIDVEWRSLVHRAWMLSQVSLTDPSVRVEIGKDGRLNLAALAPRPAGDQAAATAPARFAVGRIAISNGRIEFADRRAGYSNRFERLSLELSSLSTLEPDQGPYSLVARTPDGATLRWKGAISLQPLATSGTLMLEHGALSPLNPYLNDYTTARIASGRADVELPYRFTLAEGRPRFDIQGAKFVLHDFALAARGADAPFAKLGRLALEGVNLDLQARHVSAQALRVGDFTLAASRDAQGGLDLTQLFPARGTGTSAPPWQAEIATVEFSDGSVSFADHGSGLALQLERLGVKLAGVSSDTARPLAFDLTAGIGKNGRIVAHGRATPATGMLEARVEASGVPLVPLQPLLAQYADVKLVAGELAAAGDLRAGGDRPALTYAGSAAMANVAIEDGAGTRLLAWKSLAADALRASLSPNALKINELRWIAPVGKLAIAADRTTNIGRALKRRDAAPVPATQKSGSPSGAESGFTAAVRRIRVEQGELDFSDDSLSPNFAATIRELAGTATGLSTDRDTRSLFTLEGRVNESGFARLSGALNPFVPRERTSFRVQFRNLDVTKVSPYTMKFAGYRVASGRMSLDLNYRVNNSRLEGDNQIVLDQFTLGERIENSGAPNLPIALAVALLKDANGVIDVAVPISGNLDDPQFSYGALVWKAIGNLVTKVVTAPFRLLGSLFGASGEELGAIGFEPGSSRLLPPEQEKLGRIVAALAKRPELKLVIPARYDTGADARALKRAALRREIGKRAGFDTAGEDPPGPISIDDAPTRRALRALFAERFSPEELDRLKAEAEAKAHAAAAESGKPQQISVLDRLRNFARGEPQVADARAFYRTLVRRLIDAQPLAGDALAGLARKRGAAIAAALTAAGVDPARIAQSSAEPTANAEAKQVTLQLSLAAMR